jgi:hypothetical protein
MTRLRHSISSVCILAALILVSAPGCNNSREAASDMTTGTVTRMEFEGGFWGIVGEDGTNFYPLNLAEEFQEDGLVIRFTFEPASVMSIHQWGRPVTLTKAERR